MTVECRSGKVYGEVGIAQILRGYTGMNTVYKHSMEGNLDVRGRQCLRRYAAE